MQETWVQCLGWEDPLEKGMATQFSILSWEILGNPMDKGTQQAIAMGSQRIRHDWMTNTFTFFHLGALPEMSVVPKLVSKNSHKLPVFTTQKLLPGTDREAISLLMGELCLVAF